MVLSPYPPRPFPPSLTRPSRGHPGGVADLVTDQPSSGRSTDIRALEPVLAAIELLNDAGDVKRASELYQARLDGGAIFRHLPASVEGMHCALGFVADEERRTRCEDQLSADALVFYLNAVGLYGANAGELTWAMPYFEAAEAVDRRMSNALPLCIGLQNQVSLLTTPGRLRDGEAKAREALNLAREIEDDWNVGQSLCHLGTALARRGRVGEAMAAFEEANDIEKRIDLQGHELYSPRGVRWADLLLGLGQTARARALTEANATICELHAWQDDVAGCRLTLGRLDAVEGRLDAAVEHLTAAEGVMRRGHLLQRLPPVLLARGGVERRRRRWEAAWRFVGEALRIAMPRGMRLDHADGLVLRARLRFEQEKADRTGDAEALRDAALRAQDDLDAALTLARDCGYAWAERDALELLADTSTALGEHEKAHSFRRNADALTAGLRLD